MVNLTDNGSIFQVMNTELTNCWFPIVVQILDRCNRQRYIGHEIYCNCCSCLISILGFCLKGIIKFFCFLLWTINSATATLFALSFKDLFLIFVLTLTGYVCVLLALTEYEINIFFKIFPKRLVTNFVDRVFSFVHFVHLLHIKCGIKIFHFMGSIMG